MKNLLLSALLFLSVLSYGQSQKVYYCVQVCSTENPHLLKPEMVSILPMDTAMVETAIVNEKVVYRILFVYETQDEQWICHTSWLKQWHDAMLVTRTEYQVKKMFPLFSSIRNED